MIKPGDFVKVAHLSRIWLFSGDITNQKTQGKDWLFHRRLSEDVLTICVTVHRFQFDSKISPGMIAKTEEMAWVVLGDKPIAWVFLDDLEKIDC